MQVPDTNAVLLQVVRQVFGHTLRQGRDQDPFVLRNAVIDLGQRVVDLYARAAHLDLGIHEARRPHDLLDDLAGVLGLVPPRRRRNVDSLRRYLLELLEHERSVVQGRRKPESVFDESFLA